MTAKQRAARAKFKAVVAEAKKLRKKNPKLTQAQAVKQAFAISYSKAGKSKVGAVKKSKYEVGDLVYSYQNKDYKAPISYKKFVPWESLSKPNAKDKFVYKLNIKGGYSNYINEESLSKSALGAVKKKSATRVKAKKSRSTEMHTDTKSHNVNIRVVSGIKVKSKELRKQLAKKGYRLTHGYTVVKRKSIGALPEYRDKDAAREIELYADNDSQLYYQRRRPILVNLAKKYKKGIYEIDKAAKLWKYYIEAAMQKYNKEFGSRGDKWSDLLDTHDRNLLATEYAIRTKQEFDLGNLPE